MNDVYCEPDILNSAALAVSEELDIPVVQALEFVFNSETYLTIASDIDRYGRMSQKEIDELFLHEYRFGKMKD